MGRVEGKLLGVSGAGQGGTTTRPGRKENPGGPGEDRWAHVRSARCAGLPALSVVAPARQLRTIAWALAFILGALLSFVQ
jgi:hypothetical protein